MAVITLTIPDEKITSIINSFASVYNYQETVDGEVNPESKPEFAKKMIKVFIADVHRASLLKALEATRQNLLSQAETDTSGITVG